jgi:hypothetical protein
MKIKSPKNLWSALIFMGLGLFICIYGYTHYQYGSALRMGPGYFPTWLGALQFLIGLIVLISSFTVEGAKVPKFHFKPMLFVLGGTVLFGYILKPAGLVVSLIVFTFVSAYGGHEFKWKEVAWLSIALAVFSVLIFVKLLGQPFPIWPSFID